MTSAHTRYDVRIFQKECTSLAEAGFQVYLIVDDEIEDEVKNNVRIKSTFHKPKNRIDRMLNSALKVYKKALAVNAEIYHFHDPELLPYGYLLKRKGRKVIFDSHENLFGLIQEKEYISKKFRKICGNVFNFFLKILCKKFDAVISVDPKICDEYQKINNNAVLVSNFPIYTEVKTSVIEDSTAKLVFAGGVNAQWNHAAVVKALEKLEDQIEYVICGGAEEEYLEQLKRMPEWNRVSYKGIVTHEEALRMLKGRNIGIALCNYSNNTNQKKGTLGNTKLFEMMLAGIPVICTKFESWENIINEYKCGICVQDPQNSSEIAEAIEYLLKHPEKVEDMGKQGQKAIRERFNWSLEEKKLVSLYMKLLGEDH